MNPDDVTQGGQSSDDPRLDQAVDELAEDVLAQCARFEACLMRRDWIEAGTAILLLVFFGVFLWWNDVPPVMTAGIVVMMFAAMEIVLVMYWARHRDSRPREGGTMQEYSQAEMARIDRQIGLLRWVSWWYSTPLLLGCAVFMYGLLLAAPQLGRETFFAFLTAFCLCFVWMANAIYRANQRAVHNDLIPLRDRIAKFLDALTATADSDSAARG